MKGEGSKPPGKKSPKTKAEPVKDGISLKSPPKNPKRQKRSSQWLTSKFPTQQQLAIFGLRDSENDSRFDGACRNTAITNTSPSTLSKNMLEPT